MLNIVDDDGDVNDSESVNDNGIDDVNDDDDSDDNDDDSDTDYGNDDADDDVDNNVYFTRPAVPRAAALGVAGQLRARGRHSR